MAQGNVYSFSLASKKRNAKADADNSKTLLLPKVGDAPRAHRERLSAARELAAQIVSTAVMTGLLLVSVVHDLLKWLRSPGKTQVLRRFSYSLSPKDATAPRRREKPSLDAAYYVGFWGYYMEEHRAVTADGFVVYLHRVMKARGQVGDKGPVLVVHGMFQSSGVFLTNEKESLAFHLVDSGYDVWLGNNRCVYEEHAHLSPAEHEFWDWNIDDMAKYDFPTMVDYVVHKTKHAQIAYIGHSQGNGQAWMGLAQRPDIAAKLKLFVSLAPPVYVGDLLTTKPMAYLLDIPDSVFNGLFGTKDFITIMHPLQRVLPAWLFTALAYRMFNFLFGWSERNWLAERKPKYFMFTPRPVAAKLVDHWRKIAKRQSLIEGLDFADIKCPLAIFYGTDDKIIDGDKLIAELTSPRYAGVVKLLHSSRIEGYEHMDVLWGRDAPEKVFKKLVQLLDSLE